MLLTRAHLESDSDSVALGKVQAMLAGASLYRTPDLTAFGKIIGIAGDNHVVDERMAALPAVAIGIMQGHLFLKMGRIFDISSSPQIAIRTGYWLEVVADICRWKVEHSSPPIAFLGCAQALVDTSDLHLAGLTMIR